jgi:class 3 adenylate cyclase/tetratricopeptide (TPR) repeat protein
VPICSKCGHENPAGARFCNACATLLDERASEREQRKTVTVLFCDVTGSTALGESADPEALRILLAHYFERMKAIVEGHGGTVEKFIGDAVMAVFGVPQVREDDALRACRAAVEMRDAFPEVGVKARIGLNTGEVVTGTEERLATGDAVNVAARLEQAAGPGEVLVGAATLALVREAVDVEALEPLELKGKAEPVCAYRLLAAREAAGRRADARFVGRGKEVALIHDAWERALAERRCELVTIVGEAGVGKSRLVKEALTSDGLRVVHGRCLSYGEGITYWPVVEIVKQLRARPNDEAAAAAIASLLGETDAATSAEEIAWAMRKLLEEQAPLIAVFDDIQWGEEVFLDLVEHVALLSSGAPILLLAIARPDLTERRVEWPVTLRLDPLAPAEAEQLIPQAISGKLRGQIARAAAGNPLFVEEMVAMADEAAGDVVVPPTLQALLATRLDQLEPAERALLERGAIEGEVFHRGAVQALAPEETQVTPRLASLVRKGLIRPVKAQLAGQDGFRFHHLLIRDAAYAGLPKATRARLHEAFAAWLDNRGADLVELEELLGYHLEQACRYRRELGVTDDGELPDAARRHLAASGRRALARQDFGAAVNLLERAAALLPAGDVDIPLELSVAAALAWRGQVREALRRASSIVERASAAGDRVGELCARLEEAMLRVYVEPEGAIEPLAVLVEQALPVFEAAGDDFALQRAYRALAEVADWRGQKDASAEAFERAATHARRGGFPGQRLVTFASNARFHGTTRLSELLAWQDTQEEGTRRNPWLRSTRARALAMMGRFDEARAILVELRAEWVDRGGGILRIVTEAGALEVELLAGQPAAAVSPGEELCRLYEESGFHGFLSWALGMLGQAYYAVGRLEDAEAAADRAGDFVAGGDPDTIWQQVKAKVLARRCEKTEARRLARMAVDITDATQMLNAQADAYADFAEVLEFVGSSEGAAKALGQALTRYEQKENIVMARRVRGRLAKLASPETTAESR